MISCEKCDETFDTQTDLNMHEHHKHADKKENDEEPTNEDPVAESSEVNLAVDTTIHDSQNISSNPEESQNGLQAVPQPAADDQRSEETPFNSDDAPISMESEDDDKSVSDEFEWSNNENGINTNDVQPGEVSTQTDEINCDDCANKSKKIEYFEILEKEHKELMVQHERFTTLYYDQADEKEVLRTKIVELEQIKFDQSKEILKMKRETTKNVMTR